MNDCQPFNLSVPDEILADIRARVLAYPWHEMPDDGGWDYGTNLDYLQEFCNYWTTAFDWREQEAKINRFSHFKVPVDGIDLHFIHEKGSGPNPRPLIISHGWPGSIVEFLEFIDLLAHPEQHGGSVDDAFTVIAPSLPGFGFSARPPRPWGPRKMADLFNTLMTDVLGYEHYIAQGGDWGGAISSWLGFEHPACAAIHINILTMRHKDEPQGTEEINTASWIYYGRREEGGRVLSPDGKRVEVPTACALFPRELLAWPPRSYAERIYNVTQWTEMPRGGHFAAMEAPDLLIDDIRKFSRTLDWPD